MKNINIWMISSLLLLLSSCYKDQSNYNFLGEEVITVSEIDTVYSILVGVDSLIIRPEVISNKDADFEYFWGIYPKSAGAGSVERFDTLSKSKDLEVMIAKEAKEWAIVFSAKNKLTGYSVFKTAKVSIRTEFSRGWYVLKDDGQAADVDFHTSSTSVAPTAFAENVYSQINGRKLTGKGINIGFHQKFVESRNTANGTTVETPSLYFASERDYAVTRVSDMLAIRDYQSAFVFASPNPSIGGIFNAAGGHVIVNNGKLHQMAIGIFSASQFGIPVTTALTNDYEAAPYILGTPVGEPYFFDNKSSKFMISKTRAAGEVSEFSSPLETVNLKALYMGLRLPRGSTGNRSESVGIFQDKTDANKKLMLTFTGANSNGPNLLQVNRYVIPVTSELFNATHYTVNMEENEKILYFVINGNELWSIKLDGTLPELQYTAPAGELITYIRHKKYDISADSGFSFDYIIVGIETSGRYKLHMFNKTGGKLNSTPEFTLQGNGTARDVIYLSPSVLNTTYVPAR